MMKRFKSKTLVSALALIMGATILMAPLAAYAVDRPSAYWDRREINGDGVRHRAEPGSNGTILGLMYKGDIVWLAASVLPPTGLSSWVAAWREETEQLGWIEWSYY